MHLCLYKGVCSLLGTELRSSIMVVEPSHQPKCWLLRLFSAQSPGGGQDQVLKYEELYLHYYPCRIIFIHSSYNRASLAWRTILGGTLTGQSPLSKPRFLSRQALVPLSHVLLTIIIRKLETPLAMPQPPQGQFVSYEILISISSCISYPWTNTEGSSILSIFSKHPFGILISY